MALGGALPPEAPFYFHGAMAAIGGTCVMNAAVPFICLPPRIRRIPSAWADAFPAPSFRQASAAAASILLERGYSGSRVAITVGQGSHYRGRAWRWLSVLFNLIFLANNMMYWASAAIFLIARPGADHASPSWCLFSGVGIPNSLYWSS